MEEHEKKMKNLLKTLHNLGGACNNYQFRLIVITSMPEAWKDYVLNVPGIFSSEAFTYLHRLYLNKRERPTCTNPPCPTKVGHTIDRCWAKGGGAEGKAPKSWKDKYGTTASSSTTPINIFTTAGSSAQTSQSIEKSPERGNSALAGEVGEFRIWGIRDSQVRHPGQRRQEMYPTPRHETHAGFRAQSHIAVEPGQAQLQRHMGRRSDDSHDWRWKDHDDWVWQGQNV
ncbi:hypothetical protein BT96DRAFT_987869 [Gymnopus androsaceus JB14]|uniref:Uncharacterized protein n=1 Tax=Gymnopus androsaceus JB14 TaxID=1447944 RepID=A0A6A4IA51_9AGAR|nr:hypothetical protein BT96DRAFT_987869 [Gymnopus androsaceus JB14]